LKQASTNVEEWFQHWRGPLRLRQKRIMDSWAPSMVPLCLNGLTYNSPAYHQ